MTLDLTYYRNLKMQLKTNKETMKATVEFNLEDEDDKNVLKDITSDELGKLRRAMWNFSNDTLRKYRKYGVPMDKLDNTSSEATAASLLELITSAFYIAVDDEHANLED